MMVLMAGPELLKKRQERSLMRYEDCWLMRRALMTLLFGGVVLARCKIGKQTVISPLM